MQKENEIRIMSHLALVITVSLFSVVLIAFNLALGWERWMILLCVVAAFTCPILHITHIMSDKGRIYLYSAIFFIELFYYSVNITTIYDSTPVYIVALVVLAMTQEIALTWICIGVAYIGMIWHLIMVHNTTGLSGTFVASVRTLWHLVLIALAGVVTTELLNAIKRAESVKNERIEQLEKENKGASDFLANVSHEIRTPVNAVMGLTRVCMDKETDPQIKRNLKDISNAGKRVGEQISDILDYSEIDMNKLAVNMEDYMPSSILADLVSQIAPYKDRDIELILDVSPELPSVMRTDVSKLKKILWHLIMNGLKYTKEGGVYVHLSCLKQDYGINLIIDVKDTGIGMSAEELSHICRRFYQANSSRTRSSSGLGLGLSIVSGFVRSLNGFMTIDSEPGVGTSIRVSIPQEIIDESECMSLAHRDRVVLGGYLNFDKYPNPYVREFYNNMVKDIVKGLKVTMHRVDTADSLKTLAKNMKLTHLFVAEEEYLSCADYIDELAETVVVAVVADDGFKPGEGSKVRILKKPFYCFPVISILDSSVEDYVSEDDGRMYCKGVRALVVDDEPMNLIVAKSFLGRYDIEVTTSPSGMDSIQKCRSQDFDIVFMDHMMPEMDGVEAMKRIRADAEKLKKILPIVALTANAVSSAREMFMREGFDGFISKPIEETEFERVLKKVLPRSAITYEKDESGNDTDSLDPVSDTAGTVADEQKVSDSKGVETKKDPVLEEITKHGVDTAVGLEYCKDDAEFYKELLKVYVTEAPVKRAKIEDDFTNKDYHNYEILVHALKSTSKTIGALHMYESAKKMEDAASNGAEDYITANHPGLMSEYDELVSAIAGAFGPDILPDNDDDIMEFMPSEG